MDLQRTWPYLVESDPDQDRKYSISLGTDKNELKIIHETAIEHNCINAVITSLALEQIGNDISESMKRLSGFENPLKNRFHIHEVAKYLVIDDTYNANPTSMQSAIKNINDWNDERGRIVILGDMYDLGEHSEKEHQNLIVRSLELDNLKYLILVGERIKSALDKVKHDQKYKILHNLFFSNPDTTHL